MKMAYSLLGLTVSAALAGAAHAVPYPNTSTPVPLDLGTSRSVAGEESVSVTLALPLRNTDELATQLQATYTRGSPQYRKFLTPDEFNTRFGPSDATVAQVTQHYRNAGLQVTRESATLLKLTGTTSAIEKAFTVSLHTYQVAGENGRGYRYRAPAAAPQVDSEIAASVHAVLGLSTRPLFAPHLRRGALGTKIKNPVRTTAPNTPDAPGLWTVQDFAQYYDVTPLYKQGIEGKHQTIGIVTFASFTPSDAFAYWNSLGLPVTKNRLHIVEVDGGSGPPSDAAGSDETTLDVEQSGGIAPAANIVVYEAPNTEQGFADAFATAFNSNVADTVSVSWGEWEWEDDTQTVTDPVTGQRNVNALKAYNDLYMQAAIQGQSVFASSGDAGSYDANDTADIHPYPQFSKVVSVDSPGSQPFITAAGGTTLPGPQVYNTNTPGQTYTVNIPTEQAWGWDYLIQLCKILGYDPVSCGIFPVGSGGGVSVFFPRPFYQYLVSGTVNSAPGQVLVDETQTPPQVLYKLPANYPGRNTPDISLNADPDTGYVIWYTSDQTGFGVETYWGGTSFVAPQLNGMTALFDSALGGRVGFLNPDLYWIAGSGWGYGGRGAPLRDITAGDTWYYSARSGYDQTTGVGVPDIANLLHALE